MNRYTAAAIEARNLTNKQLAGKLSSFAPINSERFQKLLPRKRDKEIFIELMAKVERETAQDEALAFLTENIGRVGGVVLKALKVYL